MYLNFKKFKINAVIPKYGDPHYTNREKNKQTCLDKYGVDNPMKNKEIQQKFINTMLMRYGVEYPMLNKISINKLSNSLIKAHYDGKYDVTGKEKNPSNIENQFRQYLIDNNIKFEFQYRTKKYPYLCDFYIPDYDLYIEIQGSWTHGPHPYNENSSEDAELVKKWKNKNTKFYDQAIYVWTILDVIKRNIAKENKLNYLEIYSIKIDECVLLFKNKIEEIINDNKK